MAPATNRKRKAAEPVETPEQTEIQVTEDAEEFVAWAERQPSTHHLSIEDGRELLRQIALKRKTAEPVVAPEQASVAFTEASLETLVSVHK